MGGKDDRKTGAEMSGFLTWEVSPEFLQAGKDWRETWWPGRKERHRKGRLNGLE